MPHTPDGHLHRQLLSHNSFASLSVNTKRPHERISGDSDNRPQLPGESLWCPQELQYGEDEIINVDSDNRISAGSASFSRTALKEVPLESPFPKSYEGLIPIITSFNMSIMDSVIKELYRPVDPKPSGGLGSYPDEAFKRAWGNTHRRQYYLKTLTEAHTVTHIIDDGEFFKMDKKDNTPTVGEYVYSCGFLWCNTNPNWTWRMNHGGKAIRCRIHLPAGTQVIMDRAPVYADSNQFKFDETRKSPFPDVVLPPGRFEITKVTRYRSNEDADNRRDEGDPHYVNNTDDVTGLDGKRHKTKVVLDNTQYAEHVLQDLSKFVDVELSTSALMVLPQCATLPGKKEVCATLPGKDEVCATTL